MRSCRLLKNAVVNRLLELLGGTVNAEGIIVIGATNRRQEIDAAITLAGRLKKHIVIPQPSIEALADILRHQLKWDFATLRRSFLIMGWIKAKVSDRKTCYDEIPQKTLT